MRSNLLVYAVGFRRRRLTSKYYNNFPIPVDTDQQEVLACTIIVLREWVWELLSTASGTRLIGVGYFDISVLYRARLNILKTIREND